jgi:hypothetical protein
MWHIDLVKLEKRGQTYITYEALFRIRGVLVNPDPGVVSDDQKFLSFIAGKSSIKKIKDKYKISTHFSIGI